MAACTALKLGWELFSGSATYRTLHNVHSRDKLLWHACYICWGTIMSKPFIDRKCLLAEGINIYWLAVQKKHLIPQQKFWTDKKFQHCAVSINCKVTKVHQFTEFTGFFSEILTFCGRVYFVKKTISSVVLFPVLTTALTLFTADTKWLHGLDWKFTDNPDKRLVSELKSG